MFWNLCTKQSFRTQAYKALVTLRTQKSTWLPCWYY